MEPSKNPVLPSFITGVIDLNRLIRETEGIDDAIDQLKLREPGSTVKLPKTSFLMDQLAGYYKLNLLHKKDRTNLIKYLSSIKTKAPVINISFSSDPSPRFLDGLITWLRANIHPEIMLSVGIQPTIGAGCVVRTTNKYFDFSLTENLRKSRGLLLKKITEAAAPVAETVNLEPAVEVDKAA
jgi:hypothetical protein